jgi:exodeoxyribonuclease-3
VADTPSSKPNRVPLKLATWNVNSLNVRLPRLLDWLASTQPDVVCLQETKLPDEKFPHSELREAGYASHCTGQRTYNGVALLVRAGANPVADFVDALPGFDDTQKRVIVGTIDGVRVVDFYVPNGQSIDSDKYQYKLAWCRAASAFLAAEAARHPRLAVLGDFNIAPEDRDVHDPELWRGQVLCSEPERSVFREWQGLGLKDSFRLFDQPEKTFSWWDYRQLAFPKNRGLRIDHILLSAPLAAACTSCRIDRNARKGEKPSDHAPVIAELAL